MMTSDRIKEIQQETAYPNSVSVQQALLKVWNECEQERVKNISSDTVLSDSTPSQECYKSGEPCKYNCSGLCKESC